MVLLLFSDFVSLFSPTGRYISQNTSYPSELSQVAGPLIWRRCVLSVVVASYVTPIVKTCRRLAAIRIAGRSCASSPVIRSHRSALCPAQVFFIALGGKGAPNGR